jgi:hypothetical protein
MVNKLGKDVPEPKSSNTASKIEAKYLQGLFDVHSKPPKQRLCGSSSAQHGSESYKEAVYLCNVAPEQKSTTSCTDVVNLVTHCHNTMRADGSNQASADDRFLLVTGKHKNECAVNKITNSVPVASYEILNTCVWSYKHYLLHFQLLLRKLNLCLHLFHISVLK